MNSKLRQRVQEILGEALELTPAARADFVGKACDGQRELQEEVESLLGIAEEASDFIEDPVVSLRGDRREFNAGDKIGVFRVVREIGKGGMGAVYEAVRADDAFDMRVALKVVSRGAAVDEFLGRFCRERQILAGLDHPNVAKLLDGGTTDDGRPYFAMEYIDGQDIATYCDAAQLGVRERLRLFLDVCSAVQYAHQNFVVHRDLKPGNILVSPEGQPKLLDFGIAKLLDGGVASPEATTQVNLTGPSSQPMTLAYASPEQILSGAITAASDVYSLGVLLYEMLTGHSPYRVTRRTVDAIRQAALEQEPTKLSSIVGMAEDVESSSGRFIHIDPDSVSSARGSDVHGLRRRLRGDLDCIVLKALRKEPERRYPSVERLIEDLRRYLEGLPVSARRGTFTYRSSKFIQRNRVKLTLAGAALAIAVVVALMYRHQERSLQHFDDSISDLVLLTRAPGRDPDDFSADLRRRLADYGDRSAFARLLDEKALALKDRGDLDTAEVLYREALAMWRRIHDDHEVISGLNRLAANLTDQGRLEEAEALYQESLAMRQEAYGHDSEEVARVLNNLAVVYERDGRHAAAEDLAVESLEIRQALAAPDNLLIASSHNNLALYKQLQGKHAAAEEHYLKALGLMQEQEPEERIAWIQRNLATLYLDMGRLEEAESWARKALARLRRQQLYWRIADAESVLGGCLLAQGRYQEAEPLLAWSYPEIAAAKGDEARQSREAKQRLEQARQILDRGGTESSPGSVGGTS